MSAHRFHFPDYVCMLPHLEAAAAWQRVWSAVFRRAFDQPGFLLLVLPRGTTSRQQRRFMVELKEALSSQYEAEFGEPLGYLSLGRFDQQTTTKLHLDGAPELSFLMLGYEPSTVPSQLHIADYSRTADRLGLMPLEFLDRHNPMFADGQGLLEPDTITLRDWFEDAPGVLFLNNSRTAPGHPRHSPGVLHGATVISPDPQASRIINSTMIAPARYAEQDGSTHEQVFLSTKAISGPIIL